MKKKILFLEPFYGGSHKDFADGLAAHSRHDIRLVSLPDRFWKWRMRGAALYFSREITNPEDYDLVFLSDLMSLSDLKALWGRRCPESIVYFHENQLSYPLPPGEKMDYQFGFTDITTGLAADRLVFNSRYHMDTFFSALPGFIRKMPEFKPMWAPAEIKKKSSFLYPGCDFSIPESAVGKRNEIPLIIWNHRWEFDKNPEAFFHALAEADKRGLNFNIALMGENFQAVPKPFLEAKKRYGNRIINYGFLESRKDYIEMLSRGDIMISTSNQENYGIAVIESIRYGCRPLLPDRLSYPEIIPKEYHGSVLYKDDEDLTEKLCVLLSGEWNNHLPGLKESMNKYSWKNLIECYDRIFDNPFLHFNQ